MMQGHQPISRQLRASARLDRNWNRCNDPTLSHPPHRHRKAALAKLIRRAKTGLVLNEHINEPGDVVFRHACKLGLEGIVSKRLGSRYRSGRSRHWIKSKNPAAPAVKREAEEDWGKEKWR
jgi:ATP-dependent DNA ligase